MADNSILSSSTTTTKASSQRRMKHQARDALSKLLMTLLGLFILAVFLLPLAYVLATAFSLILS